MHSRYIPTPATPIPDSQQGEQLYSFKSFYPGLCPKTTQLTDYGPEILSQNQSFNLKLFLSGIYHRG